MASNHLPCGTPTRHAVLHCRLHSNENLHVLMPNAKHLSREECDAMPAFVTYRLQHIFSFVEEKNLELIESKKAHYCKYFKFYSCFF